MKTLDVVSVGEPMVEFNAVPGEPGRYLQGFGGDTMNALIAAARQGARTAYLTRIGDDAFGSLLLDLWATEGVDASAVAVDAGAPTGIYFVTHGPAGHVFTYRRAGSAASRLCPASLPRQPIAAARFLHLSGITQAISSTACDAAFAAVECARAADTRVAYDPNLRLRLWSLGRARAVIRETASLADHFLPSLEDGRVLSGEDDPEAVLDWALATGARRVVLKLGADGAVTSDGRKTLRIPATSARAVDATGAGDCFAGTYLARLAAGDTVEGALRYAACAAAMACEGFGAVAPIPRPEAVRARMAGA